MWRHSYVGGHEGGARVLWSHGGLVLVELRATLVLVGIRLAGLVLMGLGLAALVLVGRGSCWWGGGVVTAW